MRCPSGLASKSVVERLRALIALLMFTAMFASCGEGTSGPTEVPTPPPPPPAPPPSGDLTVVKIEGDQQMRFPGSKLVQGLCVQVTDGSGVAVGQGLAAHWEVIEGGGVLTPMSATTDHLGRSFASFTLGEAEGNYVIEASVDGVGSVRFAATARESTGPIAFASSRYGGLNTNWHILTMEANGSHVMALTDSDDVDAKPSWSPDGTEVLFTRSAANGNQSFIYVINADGTGERQLTDDGISWTSGGSDWSPDGSKIVFVRGVPNNEDIWVMDADGSNPVRLTNQFVDFDPQWSPDGSRIAFVRFIEGEGWQNDVYVMDSDGSNVQRLTHDEPINFLPRWSPDGTQLIYQVGQMPSRTYSMHADGSGQRFLTQGYPGSWSQDGSYVLVFDYGIGEGALWDVFKVDVETGERENLTSNPALDNWPTWRW